MKHTFRAFFLCCVFFSTILLASPPPKKPQIKKIAPSLLKPFYAPATEILRLESPNLKQPKSLKIPKATPKPASGYHEGDKAYA